MNLQRAAMANLRSDLVKALAAVDRAIEDLATPPGPATSKPVADLDSQLATLRWSVLAWPPDQLERRVDTVRQLAKEACDRDDHESALLLSMELLYIKRRMLGLQLETGAKL